MKNFPVKVDNKEYWISRSIAVATFLFTYDKDNDLCILANKRGLGAADFQSYWNCPCGYLDYNETIEQAARREVYEETGIICPPYLSLYGIDSNPLSHSQNVTIQYYGHIDNPIFVPPTGGEKDEVELVSWIKIKHLDNYKWAFDHNIIITNIEECYYK